MKIINYNNTDRYENENIKVVNYNNADRYENEKVKVVNYNNTEKYEKAKKKKDQNIQLFISAININNLECLDHILNNKNIIYGIYKKNYLTSDRLEYILKKKNKTIVLPILLKKFNKEKLNRIIKCLI